MSASSENRQRGDSLIEVLMALSLTAITALGLIAAQTWLARSERARLMHERAALIADSVAEGVQSEAVRTAVVSYWRTRAASMLPGGDVIVLNQADGVHVAVVSWQAKETCDEPQAGASRACVSLAFAR
jgi:Tfp pilus assembly protein PilV